MKTRNTIKKLEIEKGFLVCCSRSFIFQITLHFGKSYLYIKNKVHKDANKNHLLKKHIQHNGKKETKTKTTD